MIFDNDGVVVDSEQLANRVCAEVLTDLGWPCTYEYSIEHFLGTSLAAVRDHVERLAGRCLDADFERRYHDRLFAEFDLSLSAVPESPTHWTALTHRSAWRPRATITAFDMRRPMWAAHLVRWTHIQRAEDVARGKPEPDLFLFVAASEGAGPSPLCRYRGQSLWGPGRKERGDGRHRVRSCDAPAERLSAADVVIRDMANVVEALNSLTPAARLSAQRQPHGTSHSRPSRDRWPKRPP